MTLRAFTGLFPALFAGLLVCCPLLHAANSAKPAGQSPDLLGEKLGSSQSPIHVTADRMETNQIEKTIIFENHVVVTQDDVTITSNRLKVTLLQGENQQPASVDSSPSQKIDFIEFEGDVKFTQLDRVATAQKAIFYQKEQKIVLHGRPVVTKGQDRIEGKLITLYTKEGRSVVEGGSDGQGAEIPVRATLYPEKKE